MCCQNEHVAASQCPLHSFCDLSPDHAVLKYRFDIDRACFFVPAILKLLDVEKLRPRRYANGIWPSLGSSWQQRDRTGSESIEENADIKDCRPGTRVHCWLPGDCLRLRRS